MNQGIIENLEILAAYYKKVRDRFRAGAYARAVVAIRGYNKEITSGKQAKKIDGVGKSIADKIQEYIFTGYIQQVEDIKEEMKKQEEKTSEQKTIEMFKKIHDVGEITARKFYDLGMRTLDDIRRNQNLLTRNQKIGLKYYNDLQKRITRGYIDTFALVLAYIFSKEFGGGTYEMDIAGSYRRGKSSSGDIDCLLSSKTFTLEQAVKTLQRYKVVTDILSMKSKKFMGIATCPGGDGFHFRLDIQFLPEEFYGSGLLYFTGSKAFNVQMRMKAKKQGYILNEEGLHDARTGDRLPLFTEREIMKQLGMAYVPPERR